MKIEQLTDDLYTELVLAFSKRVVDEEEIKSLLTTVFEEAWNDGYEECERDNFLDYPPQPR